MPTTRSRLGFKLHTKIRHDVCPWRDDRVRAVRRLDEHLERLLEAHILYASHELGQVRYAFRHALIREAAYASMPAVTRRVNHARVAEAMAALAGD